MAPLRTTRTRAALSLFGATATGDLGDVRAAIGQVLVAVGVDLDSPTPVRWMCDQTATGLDLTAWHAADAIAMQSPRLVDNRATPAAEFELTREEGITLGLRLLEMPEVWATEVDLVVNEIVAARKVAA